MSITNGSRQTRLNICVFGVGGVGGYFGSLITKAFTENHDIFFIARGTHKEAISKNGLTLKKSGGAEIVKVFPKFCSDSVKDLPVCDIIFLSVKAYDIANAAIEISKISTNKTIVLPLMNGVDIYQRIRKNLDKAVVLQSCVYVGTHIESPGVIYQKGGSCKVSIGMDPQFPEVYPENLLQILKGSSIDFDWEENIQISIWSKYMFIASFGLVSSAYSKTLGEISEDRELSALTISIMVEIEAITKALNIRLPADIVDISFAKAKEFPYETKTSFQRDVESKGQVNEADLFGGAIIRYGEELKLPTSNTKHVYEKLLNKVKNVSMNA